MPPERYIAIGSNGTVVIGPTELDPSLHDGVNDLPWFRGKSRAIWERFGGWAANSKIDKTFELWRVTAAVAKGRVVHETRVRWRLDHDQSIHEGEAFFKPGWTRNSSQPLLTAARATGGNYSVVRSKQHPEEARRADNVGRFLFDAPLSGRVALSKSSSTAPLPWTHDELLIVLNVYHKLPFAEVRERQPIIATLADRLGRSARSVVMKLHDFALLDSSLGSRRLAITQNPGVREREVWKDFYEQADDLVPLSEELLRERFGADDHSDLETSLVDGIRLRRLPEPQGPTEKSAITKQRCGQEYFRDRVINNFGGRCGVTGLALRDLLVASHILPWSTHPEHRLNVCNGLCLSRLFDAAFDRHLISFDARLRLVLSPRLEAELNHASVAEHFGKYVGETLCLPDGAKCPDAGFLAEHQAITLRRV